MAQKEDTSSWTKEDWTEWYDSFDGDKDKDTKDAEYTCTTSGEPDALSSLPAPQSCVMHDGVRRCWYTYTPAHAVGSRMPLILDLHGAGMCAVEQAAVSRWKDLADREPVTVIWVQGIIDPGEGIPNWGAEGAAAEPGTTKVIVDDVGFLKKIISAEFGRRQDLQRDRIYMAGYSAGCMMAQRFVVEASDLVAAVGCQSGYLLKPSTAIPSNFQPVPIITVHGNQDAVVAYSMDNIRKWSQLNDCGNETASGVAQPVVTSHNGYIMHAWTDCEDGTTSGAGVETVLMELPGVGHASYPPLGTPVNTTQLVWEFVQRYRRENVTLPISVDVDAPPSNQTQAPENNQQKIALNSTNSVSASFDPSIGQLTCLLLTGYIVLYI